MINIHRINEEISSILPSRIPSSLKYKMHSRPINKCQFYIFAIDNLCTFGCNNLFSTSHHLFNGNLTIYSLGQELDKYTQATCHSAIHIPQAIHIIHIPTKY